MRNSLIVPFWIYALNNSSKVIFATIQSSIKKCRWSLSSSRNFDLSKSLISFGEAISKGLVEAASVKNNECASKSVIERIESAVDQVLDTNEKLLTTTRELQNELIQTRLVNEKLLNFLAQYFE